MVEAGDLKNRIGIICIDLIQHKNYYQFVSNNLLPERLRRAKNDKQLGRDHHLATYTALSLTKPVPLITLEGMLDPQPKNKHSIALFTLSSLALIVWTISVYAYNFDGSQMPDFSTELRFEFSRAIDLIFVGLHEMLIPVLGVAALTFTQPLQRILSRQAIKYDLLKIGIALTFLQALFFLYKYRLFLQTEEEVTLGLFCVVVAALLGGRKLGVPLGIMTMILGGLYFHLTEIALGNDESVYIFWLLANLGIAGALWAGWMIGVSAEQWPHKRFSLRFVLPLVLTLTVAILITIIFTRPDTSLQYEWIVPRLVVLLISLALILRLFRYQQERERPHALTKHELEVVRAELRALRAQINPHFLFNSLSVIHHLIRTNPAHARDLILDLSAMMQHTLKAGQFVPLQMEIEHVKAYLALEKVRLTNRLHINWHIDDRIPLQAPVPTLIVQPIVENAIIHGIAPKPEGGSVHIDIQLQDQMITIQIKDDGLGFDAAQEVTSPPSFVDEIISGSKVSIGISNVDQRLRLLYGEVYRLDIDSGLGRGTTVTIKIPLPE